MPNGKGLLRCYYRHLQLGQGCGAWSGLSTPFSWANRRSRVGFECEGMHFLFRCANWGTRGFRFRNKQESDDWFYTATSALVFPSWRQYGTASPQLTSIAWERGTKIKIGWIRQVRIETSVHHICKSVLLARRSPPETVLGKVCGFLRKCGKS